ncbi:hypothetical protein [Nesterenkonia muleiensis]|uniref:hypothetical protein n=1 Tax=Nesterenkonia muleiensis TaxID=2282648 RepID=UPI001300A06C|nr:hypothetical protein [Nesterenkonia muleiensis]
MESLEIELTDDELSNLSAIEEHIDSDGQLSLTAAEDDSRIDQAFLEEFAEGYASLGNGSGISGQTVQPSEATTSSNGVGINTVIGSAMYLDSGNASALSASMATGVTVAGIVGFLTAKTGIGPVAAATTAGALGLIGGLSALCNSWGRGIVMSTGPTPVCWSQPEW